MTTPHSHLSAAFSHTNTMSPRGNESTNNHLTIVGVVLGVIGVLLVAGVLYMTMRIRSEATSNNVPNSRSFFSSFLRRRPDSKHPALHITPFGSSAIEIPRFKHTPGSDMRIATRRPDGGWHFSAPQTPTTPLSAPKYGAPSPATLKGTLPPDMRIATRRSDGAWQFSDPQTPFTPSGVADIDITPPPTSSTITRPPWVASRNGKSKTSMLDRPYEFEISLPPSSVHGYDYNGHLSVSK